MSLTGAFEVAIAVLLGICIMIVLVIIGYYYLKNRKKNSRRRQPATATNSTLSTTEDTEHLVYNSTTKPIWPKMLPSDLAVGTVPHDCGGLFETKVAEGLLASLFIFLC